MAKCLGILLLLLGVTLAARAQAEGQPTPSRSAAPSAERPANTSAAAKSHLDKGLELYRRGHYDDAIVEFQAGYALDPTAELIYALGQAERKRGRCDRAMPYFEELLGQIPPGLQADAVRFQLERCKREIGASSQPPAVAPTPVTTPAAPLPAPTRPFYQDWVGDILTGGGVVALGVGAWLFVSGNSALGDAHLSYDRYDAAQSAEGERTAGAVVMAIGGGLVVGGVLRYWLHGRGAEPPRVAVGAAAASGRAFIHVVGRF